MRNDSQSEMTPRQRTDAATHLLIQRQMLRDMLATAEKGLAELGASDLKVPQPSLERVRAASFAPGGGEFAVEYRSAVVGEVARHLGAAVDGTNCPGVACKFSIQFGPELFPLPVGQLIGFPDWTSPDFEASASISAEQCQMLFNLRKRRYRTPYVLVGPNSNSGLRDTMKDCGIDLPALTTPLAFFWGLATDPGPDEDGN